MTEEARELLASKLEKFRFSILDAVEIDNGDIVVGKHDAELLQSAIDLLRAKPPAVDVDTAKLRDSNGDILDADCNRLDEWWHS